MSDFESHGSKDGFSMKLWRGERMCLLGFDVTDPEPDFVGFAIECKNPTSSRFVPLRNRLAFSYDTSVETAVNGARRFESRHAPFQKFRWIHFPKDPQPGLYTYRGTKMHMPQDGRVLPGTSLELQVSLDPITYSNFLDVGFTRNFASSQAYAERFKNRTDVIPRLADEGLGFTKLTGDIYDWLGFEAFDLIFEFLKEAAEDPAIELDVFAFDLNEPDIVALLEKMGPRLRVIIDDSKVKKKGILSGHGAAHSAESMAAERLKLSAGADHVRRTHFSSLQHHKVFIAKRSGVPFKVLTGSTNFSFRGLYIQANNVLVFRSQDVAALFGKVFDLAFRKPSTFKRSEFSADWFPLEGNPAEGIPPVRLCFSPHRGSDVSLIPVRDAIDGAESSVLYSVAFLSQIKSGPTKAALDRLINRPLFSYGISNTRGKLRVQKPDGSTGLVDFAYLADKSPQPFRAEWSGGSGINVHHKFVVTDFNLPTAKVFTGSSNLAPGGEEGNGDHLIMIQDRKVAIGFAIEALRIFDHLHFRTRMKEAANVRSEARKVEKLTLRKPTAISGAEAWFERYYEPDSQRERDRLLFSR